MTTLREALKKKLTKKEMTLLRASFDVVGDIAIIEVPLTLKKREKLIAQTLLNLVKNIKVVAVKEGSHKGKYRRQKMKILAGEKRSETMHKESGITMKLDVKKCYFSQRLGTERLRIAKKVKKREKILVVGSGVGPYPLVIARHSKAKEITGVEINPIAHKYAKENVIANKMQNKIILVKGDARRKKLGKFDRIITTIPHKGSKIIPSLLKCAKRGAYLHVLDFVSEENLMGAGEKLKEACKAKKRKCRVIKTVKVGQYAVRKYRVCVDATVD